MDKLLRGLQKIQYFNQKVNIDFLTFANLYSTMSGVFHPLKSISVVKMMRSAKTRSASPLYKRTFHSRVQYML